MPLNANINARVPESLPMNMSTGNLTNRATMTIEEDRDKTKTKNELKMSWIRKPTKKAATTVIRIYSSGSSAKIGKKDTLKNM